MRKQIGDKIHAVAKRQAQQIARYTLLPIGKNAIYSLFLVLLVAVAAAAVSSSIELTAKKGGPDADSVLYHLHKLKVEDVEGMLKHFVRRSVKLMKRRFGGRKVAVAIDFTDEMFYGEKGSPGVVGTKRKNGTNYAYKFLTVSIVTDKMRFFLFAYPAFERGNNFLYVGRVLDMLEEFEVRTHVLLLDREFNDAETLKLLDRRGYRYIIPADHDSKFERWKKAAGKFPAIARGWKIGDAETTLVMLEEEGHVFGYLTNFPDKFFSEDAYVLSYLYSKRWGIETAHRVEDKFRIYTTTTDEKVRYFFFVVSVLFYNLWVWVNLTFGLWGKTMVRVDELKRILHDILDDFIRWLCNPERWFSFGLGGSLGERSFLPENTLPSQAASEP